MILIYTTFIYLPFHKTLPRSSAFVNWISVRFYETACTLIIHLFPKDFIHTVEFRFAGSIFLTSI